MANFLKLKIFFALLKIAEVLPGERAKIHIFEYFILVDYWKLYYHTSVVYRY